MWSLRRLIRRSRKIKQLDPDEIFLDAHNLPSFNTQQFEGRIEAPIAKQTIYGLALVCLIVLLVFSYRVGVIQVVRGNEFAERSDDNKLRHTPIFPDRGIIYDRNGVELVWNDNGRKYIAKPGFGHLLGFVGYPTQAEIEEFGYDPKQPVGRDGVEQSFQSKLSGAAGLRIEELNAKGEVESDHLLETAEPGKSLTLSVDARLQEGLHKGIKELSEEQGFRGGAGVIMDVKTGEILAMVSYPEYDPNIIVGGRATSTVRGYNTNPANPFLNRVISGRFTPGSTVKPIIAMGALSEKTISPNTVIVTNGKLVLPNRYNPDLPSIFPDNANHGSVDMRRALAVSSNVYFYVIGGGFGNQKGIGIYNIEKYMRLFNLGGEIDGVIPNPKWKEENFDGEPWRVGDTYHTAIGQYGVLVTPIQVMRAFAAFATDGNLITPTVLKSEDNKAVTPARTTNLDSADFQVIKEGMRRVVTEGTAQIINVPGVNMAGKSGSAEIDAGKRYVNSWFSGYWPADNPRYAISVVMDQGPRTVRTGAGSVMFRFLDFAKLHAPEYFEASPIQSFDQN